MCQSILIMAIVSDIGKCVEEHILESGGYHVSIFAGVSCVNEEEEERLTEDGRQSIQTRREAGVILSEKSDAKPRTYRYPKIIRRGRPVTVINLRPWL